MVVYVRVMLVANWYALGGNVSFPASYTSRQPTNEPTNQPITSHSSHLSLAEHGDQEGLPKGGLSFLALGWGSRLASKENPTMPNRTNHPSPISGITHHPSPITHHHFREVQQYCKPSSTHQQPRLWFHSQHYAKGLHRVSEVLSTT